MRTRNLAYSVVVVGALGAGVFALTGARYGGTIEQIDFGTVKRTVDPAYDAVLLPAQ